jgi:ADP-ribosyl-[dinitrogen reductase] hydrolase
VTSPDTYAEVYHREFFQNYGNGLPLLKCAGPDGHDTASAGGFVALLPSLLFNVASSKDPVFVEEKTLEHLRLTHTSKKLEKYAKAFIQSMWELIQQSKDLRTASEVAASKIGFKLEKLKSHDDKEVLGGIFSTACYIEVRPPFFVFIALTSKGLFSECFIFSE